jgi:hypothetical protein
MNERTTIREVIENSDKINSELNLPVRLFWSIFIFETKINFFPTVSIKMGHL